ncbi:early nodulin-like protein 3 [Salvia hispanica]|uniref:early nodulin-like protein 3 n=1 Tax=Salvia hispanica TaxID=49212 RepID=UPI0020092D3B|nr:early nodulin-like protein 3 [Salvia hispanica]
MARKSYQILSLVCLLLLVETSNGFEFKVGGPTSSWTVPSDPSVAIYNHWAEKTRFQIGDSLLFVYDSSRDSVLHVTEDDYNNCNTASPLHKLSDGRSSFRLDRSGPYYFISGVAENCRKNEKLVVVVMADRSSSHKPDDTASSPPPPEEETPSNRAAFATAGAFATLLGFSLVLVI